MAVLLSSNVHNPQLNVHSFMDSQRRLWVGQGHALLRRNSVDFADLVDEPYIMLTVDEAAETAQSYWRQLGLQPRVMLNTSSVEAVRSMVANGSGVAILSDLVHRPWSLEGKRIETVTVTDAVTPMSVGLAWHRERDLSPAMQAFRTYFHDAFLAPQQISARR